MTAALNTRLTAALTALAVIAVAFVMPTGADARSSAQLDRTERKVIRYINAMRGARGLPKLKAVASLNRAANFHSWEMLSADWFAHPSPNGTSTATRVRRYRNARKIGETLAYVPRSQRRNAWRVVEMWMNSAGHRQILLSPGFRRIGVGRRTGRLGSRKATVFTANFTSKR